VPHQDFS